MTGRKEKSSRTTTNSKPSKDSKQKTMNQLVPKSLNVLSPTSRPFSKAGPVNKLSRTHRLTGSNHAPPTFMLKVKTESIYDGKTKPSAILEAEVAREAVFINFAKQKKTLYTSFMSGRGSNSISGTGSGIKGKETAEDAKVDFLNVLNVPAFGYFTRMWVDVYFGEASNRSKSCALVIDTGSGLTWINKAAYEKALTNDAQRAVPYMDRSFQCEYAEGKIKGELYKGTISFKDKNIFVEDQIFGIVDEAKNPDVKRWREEKDIVGIFALGPRALNKDTILSPDGNVIKGKDVPTVLDNMKARRKVSAKVVCINFDLPSEESQATSSSGAVSSDSEARSVSGKIHFGGKKEGAFNPATLKMIPATKKGTSNNFYGVDLTLRYNGETIMGNKSGIIDSGSALIALPEAVLNAYVAKVGKYSNGDPIIKYDSDHKLYRIERADFSRLKPLEFDFGNNAKFNFPPAAQVCPPAFTRHWASDGEDVFFLNFRKLATAHEGRQFILGMGWLMWYYVVLDSSSTHKKIGIAEIEGQTNFKWKSLSQPPA